MTDGVEIMRGVSRLARFGRPATRPASWTLPLISIALCWLMAPPNRVEWLVWVAFAPLFAWLGLDRVSGRRAMVGAGLVGSLYYLAISRPLLSLSWWGWGTATGTQFTAFVWHQKALVLLVIVSLSLWGGLLWGLCGWLTKRYATTPLRTVWLIPSLWVLLVEFLGHQTVSGMGWGLLGFHLHGAPLVRQFAGVGGVPGLSFLVLLVNAALSLVPTRSRAALMTAGLAVAVALVAGLAAARAVSASSSSFLKVAVLQGNVLESRLEDFTPDGLDQTYQPMLREALEAGADLVVLPETVWLRTLQLDQTTSPWDTANQLVERAAIGRTFANLLDGRSSLIIHGIDAVRGGRMYNAMAFWTVQGLAGTYFKRHLVPFAEFAPRGLGWLSPQNRLHGSGFAYTPGQDPSLVAFRGIPIGSVICQEIMFAEPLRQTVRADAQLLVTTGNDGVFVDPAVGDTLHAMAVIRAVEHGRYLVRSMKTGVSSVIDPTGRPLALAPHGVRTVISASVSPRSGLTLYDRFGGWLILLCGVLAAAIVMQGMRNGQGRADTR